VAPPSPGQDSAQLFYYADGSIDITWTEYLSMGCTVTPTHFTIGQIEGDANILVVNYRFDPPMYAIQGRLFRQITVTCPEPIGSFVLETGINWLTSAGGSLTSDWLRIQGSVSGETGTFSYDFTA